MHSREEAHVSTACLIVRITNCREHPLGPGLSGSIGAEEVVEDSRVQRPDIFSLIVIVVGLNFGALHIMREIDH